MAGGNKSVVLSILGDNAKAIEAIKEVDEAEAELKAHSDDIVIDASTAEADAALEKVTEALDEYTKAADEATQAQERLDELQAKEDTSADELAAAQDKLTGATLRSLDAQIKLGNAELEASAKAKENADAQEGSAAKTDEASAAAEEGRHHWGMLALGVGAAAGIFVDMAAKFQEGATTLVTGAGESDKALGGVEQGMLRVSAQTGTSAADIEKAMFMIESAGYHGAHGIEVLESVAKGAKATGANLADMANVVTSALNAYHLSGDKAANVTSELISTVSHGKMTMSDLATSLANVLPIAASAHISLAQVGGAMATMTSQGMTARRASMNLANMIRSIIAPSSGASAEMQAVGLNANKLASNIGKVGLTGTLQEMTQAILNSVHGGKELGASYAGMTAQTKQYAEAILQGKLSTNDLTNAEKAMTPQQAALIANFAKMASSATGVKQTYDSALKTMTGGATGLNVALLLTGKHMSTFEANSKGIAKAGESGKTLADTWKKAAGDFGTQVEIAKTSVEDLGISIGLKLIPVVTALIKPISSFLEWLMKLPGAGIAIVGIIAVFLSLWAAIKVGAGVKTIIGGVEEALTFLKEALFETAGAEEGAEAAQWGLNAAWLASPITWIIAGIALLVIGFIELWKHCSAFRDAVKDAFRWFKDVIVDVWDWIKGHWHLLLDILIGPIGMAVMFIVTHWREVSRIFLDVYHDVTGFAAEMGRDVIRFITGMVETGVRWFIRLQTEILHVLADAAHWLIGIGEDLIRGLINGIENMAGSLLSTISRLAGDVTGAFKKVLGIFSPSRVFMEHGKNIVLGLVAGINGYAHLAEGAISSLAQRTINASGGRFSGGGNGGGTININFNGLVAGSPDAIAKQIQTMLLDLKRHRGNAALGLA